MSDDPDLAEGMDRPPRLGKRPPHEFGGHHHVAR